MCALLKSHHKKGKINLDRKNIKKVNTPEYTRGDAGQMVNSFFFPIPFWKAKERKKLKNGSLL